MKISVLGTGYVGLVAGTCFAENGNEVWCVDLNAQKIENLKNGILPIYEPGLEDLVKRNAKEGRLQFTTNSADAIQNTDIVFIAVGTPSSSDGSADLELFMKAAETIAENLNGYKVVVNKSTVPVGTAAKVFNLIKSKTTQKFDVVSNPEFLKEGSAIDDFLRPDRVVIGCATDQAFHIMAELYAPFVRQGNPVIRMNNVSAEMTKYAANSFLATKISFINEIANLCESVGADIESVRKGITSDERIGRHFLYAGAGYGGSCFPKDVKALLKTGQTHGHSMDVIAAAEAVNAHQKRRLFEKLAQHFGGAGQLRGKTIGIWGLAFKPNTDDMREAPSLVLIEALLREGAKVQVYDPVALKEAQHILHAQYGGKVQDHVQFCTLPYDAAKNADALIVVTEWSEFRNPDFNKLRTTLKQPVIVDGRNIYSLEKMKQEGFRYYSIGRQPQ